MTAMGIVSGRRRGSLIRHTHASLWRAGKAESAYYEAVRVLLEKLARPLAPRLRCSRLAGDPGWA